MLSSVPIVLTIIISCSTPPSLALDAAPDSLRYVFAFFRHGIRTPVFDVLPNDLNKEEYIHLSGGIPGGLSIAGKQLMYKVGTELKTRYGDFIGDYREDTVYVSSTQVSRTIMSALTVMAGMFPSSIFIDLPWQPIPVWQNTLEMDKSFVLMDQDFPAIASQICPKYAELVYKAKESFTNQDIRLSNDILYKLIQQHTKNPAINSQKHLNAIFDTLYFAERNGLSMPDWVLRPQTELGNKPIYPDLLHPFLSEYFTTMVYHERNEDMLNFLSGPLFNTINTKLLKKSMEVDTPDKFMFHATHDITIYALLRELQCDDPLTAEPGDGLIFELHEENDSKYVMIFMYHARSNSLKEIESPQCPTPCTLEVFTTTFKALTPQQWTLKCTV